MDTTSRNLLHTFGRDRLPTCACISKTVLSGHHVYIVDILLSFLSQLCETYCSVLYVPAAVGNSVIMGSAKFRSKGRLPALSFYYAPKQVSPATRREREKDRGRKREKDRERDRERERQRERQGERETERDRHRAGGSKVWLIRH